MNPEEQPQNYPQPPQPQQPGEPVAAPTPSPEPPVSPPVTAPVTEPVPPPQTIPAVSPAATPAPEPVVAPTPPGPMMTTPTMAAQPVSIPSLSPAPNGGPLPAADAPRANLFARKKRLIFIVLGVVILIAIGLYSFFFKTQTGPQLFVGQNRYLYACSATTPDTVARVMGYSQNKDQQSVINSFSYAPDNTKDHKLDLLQVIDTQSISTNGCTIAIATQPATKDTPSPPRQDVYTSLIQFKDAASATQGLTSNKRDGDKPLPAFPTTSLYSQPQTNDQDPSQVAIAASIVHKNVIVFYSIFVPTGATSEQYTDKITALAQAAIANIDNGSATKVTSYQHYTSVGSTPFIDVCTSLDFAKIAHVLGGGSQFNPDNFQATENFGKSLAYTPSPSIQSACTINFRTLDEAAQQAKLPKTVSSQSGDTAPFDANFAHSIFMDIIATGSANDAAQILSNATSQYKPQPGNGPLTPITLAGANGYKGAVSLPATTGSATVDGANYFVAKGPYFYSLQILYRHGQTQPFTTTSHKLSDAEAADVLQVMESAR